MSTGDMSTDALRQAAEDAAGWVARYLEGLEDRPVTPRVAPGDLRRALPTSAPEEGESMATILADVETQIAPGLTHWNHPAFFAYFNASSSG
ncbi:MAG: pyridoxal-dependent decarboxylase, partial [Acidobacteriota bacterium]